MSGALDSDSLVRAFEHSTQPTLLASLNSTSTRALALAEFHVNNPLTGHLYTTLKQLEDADPQTAMQYKEWALNKLKREDKLEKEEEKSRERDWKLALRDWKSKELRKRKGWRRIWWQVRNCRVLRKMSDSPIVEDGEERQRGERLRERKRKGGDNELFI